MASTFSGRGVEVRRRHQHGFRHPGLSRSSCPPRSSGVSVFGQPAGLGGRGAARRCAGRRSELRRRLGPGHRGHVPWLRGGGHRGRVVQRPRPAQLRQRGDAGPPCAGVIDLFEEGDVARVDWHTGHVENTTKGTSIEGVPVHSALRDIVEAGGVEDMLRRRDISLRRPRCSPQAGRNDQTEGGQ